MLGAIPPLLVRLYEVHRNNVTFTLHKIIHLLEDERKGKEPDKLALDSTGLDQSELI
jgi:uncharacterized protein (DUF302 family)